jgi:hypothetical protein
MCVHSLTRITVNIIEDEVSDSGDAPMDRSKYKLRC